MALAITISPPKNSSSLTWLQVVVAGMVVVCLAFQIGGTAKMLRTVRSIVLTPVEDTLAENTVIKANGHQALVDAWFDEVVGEGETTCRSVQERKQSGQWPDPNGGKVYLRLVTTKPPFFVSVHDKSYDQLRWGTIFVRGTYYETKVIRRFEYILGETQETWNYSSSTLPIVVDVGGNIGYYTLLSAAWKHAVVTFEINPTNVMRLCESVHINQPSPLAVSNLELPMSVKIHRQGVSNATGKPLIVNVPRNPGATGLNNAKTGEAENEDTTTHQFTVTTTTLDDFASRYGWFDREDIHISILKVDTEGHEPFILQGAKHFMQSHLARNILLEYQSNCLNATLDLLDGGYRLIDDPRNGRIPPRMMSLEESKSWLISTTKAKQSYLDLWLRLADLPFTVNNVF